MTSNSTAGIKSCLYKGRVSHRRFTPGRNGFTYSLYMLYVDLAELPDLLDPFWLWSARRPALAWFRRADHYGDPSIPLDTAIRELVAEKTGRRPEGPIRLLTHFRYFGHCFNPISIYYCFDDNEKLTQIVLEVSNTPWKEQRCYVLEAGPGDKAIHRNQFGKTLHVSPFMPMDMRYDCRYRVPGQRLNLSLANWLAGKKVFDAHLDLEQLPLTAASLRRSLISDPLATLRVTSLIHWQAFRLWCKRTPLFPHPGKLRAEGVAPHE